MENDELRQVVRDIICEEIKPTFLKMLEESEKRIERTSEMVMNLVEVSKLNIEMYDKHLLSLETSRDRAQTVAAAGMETGRALTQIVEVQRKDFQKQIDALWKDYKEMRDDNRRMSEAFMRIAEECKGNTATADVKITR